MYIRRQSEVIELFRTKIGNRLKRTAKKLFFITSGCHFFAKFIFLNRRKLRQSPAKLRVRVTGLGEFLLIGRIFAFWATIFFGQSFENSRRSPNFWATFFPRKKLSSKSGKKRIGLHFG
jgi:hypothetical protein